LRKLEEEEEEFRARQPSSILPSLNYIL
jgi:hypothetical protein